MASPPPNSFSNALEKWVYEKAVASIMLVTFTPKDVKALAKAVNQLIPSSSDVSQELARARMDKIKEDIKDIRCSTGFVMEGAPEGQVYVLTCAHTLDYLCTPAMPMDLTSLNRLFKIQILCDHGESNFRQKKANTRKYVPATVIQVDSSKDLILLQVAHSEFRKRCQEPHPPLKLARKFPEPLERIVMISWPPYRPRTACVGETSHCNRVYSTIMSETPNAHSMKLSEVNILGDKGSSGAPLLDGVADVAGVFHSGAPGTLSFSYFISFNELRNTLIRWGLIGGEQVEDDEL